jgi:hypothetical protein
MVVDYVSTISQFAIASLCPMPYAKEKGALFDMTRLSAL